MTRPSAPNLETSLSKVEVYQEFGNKVEAQTYYQIIRIDFMKNNGPKLGDLHSITPASQASAELFIPIAYLTIMDEMMKKRVQL